jgi:hypothetical protein
MNAFIVRTYGIIMTVSHTHHTQTAILLVRIAEGKSSKDPAEGNRVTSKNVNETAQPNSGWTYSTANAS